MVATRVTEDSRSKIRTLKMARLYEGEGREMNRSREAVCCLVVCLTLWSTPIFMVAHSLKQNQGIDSWLWLINTELSTIVTTISMVIMGIYCDHYSLVNSSPSVTETTNLISLCHQISPRFIREMERATKNENSSVISSYHLIDLPFSQNINASNHSKHHQWHTLFLYAWYINWLYTEDNRPGLTWWWKKDSYLDN